MSLTNQIQIAGVALALAAAPLSLRAQVLPPPDSAAVPTAGASRLEGSISIDGRLDEAAWGSAVPVTRFRQYEPNEGAAASYPTELRVVYDDQALYIGARMNQPAGVVASARRRR